MILRPQITLEPRDAEEMVRQLIARRLGYVPELEVGETGPSRALVEVAARYLQAIGQRLNRAPDKNKLAFLDTLGLALVPAQAARAPIVFQLSEQATDGHVPINTQLAAPPPPERSGQIIFETERAIGLAAGRLVEVVSLWPGRDQYIDHSEAFKTGALIRLFEKLKLRNTPHVLYLAHKTLLALAGHAHVKVKFELSQPGTAPLEIVWEYWDGKIWRAFKGMKPACQGIEEETDDGTSGLTRNGTIHLRTDCAETKETIVNRASFVITDETLEGLKSQAVPPEVLENLKQLKDERIQGQDRFVSAVEARIGSTATASFKASILKFAEKGIESFWIRGSLTQPLPPDPTTLLAEVDQIKLSTIIERPLRVSIVPQAENIADGAQSVVSALVTDASNQPLSRVRARIVDPSGDHSVAGFTDRQGRLELHEILGGAAVTCEAQVFLGQAPVEFKETKTTDGELKFTFKTDVAGFDPDKTFANETKVDVTKPFYPLGQQPQPGSAFYFSSEEVFRKPNATLQIYLARAVGPQDSLAASSTKPNDEAPPVVIKAVAPPQASKMTRLAHFLSWEYWNGRQWATLLQSKPSDDPSDGPIADLDTTEIIELTVPADMALTKVNDQEALWMRVRLVSGGFGFSNEVTWRDVSANVINRYTYLVTQPPSIAAFRLGYVWEDGPHAPQQVWTYNDFQYADRTYEATWPGKTFPAFSRVQDLTPALYLGFDKKLPVDRLSLFLDVFEQRGDTRGPEMVWEYWNGANWRELSLEDETQRLRVPGMLSFIGAEDSQTRARFESERHWLRGRLKEDGPPGEPQCAGIYPNSVWASQQQSFNNVTLGVSTGQPNQFFKFSQIPVLEGARIEVQELRGPRANVEWRILARQIAPDNPRLIADLEELLGHEGTETDLEAGDLRLRRDRNKRVTEVWVRWQEQPHLFSSRPDDRHFTIDRARGRLSFGNGKLGKALPEGATVMARQFRAGGGKAGNVAVRSIRQLLGGIAGVQGVFNPRPAEGGADGETLERFRDRGPATVRHRGRALAPQDYETLAREASPAVAVARAVSARNPSGQNLPGWVTLILIPESQDPRPWPSFGLREHVRRFVEDRAPATIAVSHHLYVTGPDYLAVDVAATIIPTNHGSDPGAVERAARAALEQFLHPLRGGPDRRGWLPGRSVFVSDLAAVLEQVEGVDYVEELTLLLAGNPQGTIVHVTEERVVVAGEIRLKLKVGEN